jgi:hypothetical protein
MRQGHTGATPDTATSDAGISLKITYYFRTLNTKIIALVISRHYAATA